MTDKEKRQQKGLLLVEQEEAEQHLAHLKTKAENMAHMLDDVASWLRGSKQDARQHDANIRGDLALYRMSADFGTILELMDEIRDIENKIREIKVKKQQFGMRP